MFFKFNSAIFVLNCDWLSFSARFCDENVSEEWLPASIYGARVELFPGTNIYKHRAVVYDADGNKMFTACWLPYSHILSRSIITCQISNYYIYKCAISIAVDVFLSMFRAEFNSVSRLDVAVDFELTATLNDSILSLMNGDYYVQGKRVGASWWHNVKASDGGTIRYPHCFSWGSISSEIKVKLYDKSYEQLVTKNEDGSFSVLGDKPYIVDEWREVGFSIDKVWRIEFSLMSAGQLKFDDNIVSLSDAKDPNFLLNAFLSLYSKRFIVRKCCCGRVGHKNLDPIVSFLDLPGEGCSIEWKKTDVQLSPSSDIIKVVRKLIAALDETACRTSLFAFDAVVAGIETMLQVPEVYYYFCRYVGSDPAAYLIEKRKSVGAGVFDESHVLKKSWD